MTVCTAFFRNDFPEFTDVLKYPDSGIAFWLNVSGQLLNTAAFGIPSNYLAVNSVPNTSGITASYAVNDVIQLDPTNGRGGATVALTVLTITPVGAFNAPNTVKTVVTGGYTLLPSNPISQYSTTGTGAGVVWNLTFFQAENAIYDIAQELFVAHNLALEVQAQNAAAFGGVPGSGVGGVISSKSVSGVSVSYDTNAGIEQGAGHWNLTTYGTRLMKLIKIFGAGPIQANIGCTPFGLGFGPAWPGVLPPPYQS